MKVTGWTSSPHKTWLFHILAELGDIISRYHIAAGGSIYIQFVDPRIGQLRIGDHKEKRCVGYRWHLRTDMGDKSIFESKGHKQFVYPKHEWKSLCNHILNYAGAIERREDLECDIEAEFDRP